jgi:hypothetical protein
MRERALRPETDFANIIILQAVPDSNLKAFEPGCVVVTVASKIQDPHAPSGLSILFLLDFNFEKKTQTMQLHCNHASSNAFRL